jgi:hypothetical protein
MAAQIGLEPITTPLTAERSTVELLCIISSVNDSNVQPRLCKRLALPIAPTEDFRLTWIRTKDFLGRSELLCPLNYKAM